MADWTNLPNAAVGVGGLPSGTTVTALRDNPIAIAEGAPGAPKIRRNNIVSGTLAQTQTFTNLDAFSGIEFFAIAATPSTNVRALQFQYSINNGTSWSNAATYDTVLAGTGIRESHGAFDFASGTLLGVTKNSNINGIAVFSQTLEGASLAINAVRFTAASSDVGQIVMLKPCGAAI